MGPKLDKWTSVACAALIVGALLACKKKEEPPPPVATTAPTPEPPKEETKKEETKKKKDTVKRYPDKEVEESGTVRVIVKDLRVYDEADDSKDFIATLSFGTLVNRKARMGNWMLVDWPSGVGELSPGWVLNRQIANKVEKVKPEDVAKQDAGVVIVKTPDVKPDAAVVAAKPDAAAPAKVDAGKLPKLNLPSLKKRP